MSQITSETVAGFAAYRLRKGLQISTVNSSLRVVRRVLKLAVEWGVADSWAKIIFLPGERHRERVVSRNEEAKYLVAAPEPLASVATLLCDTGLRPEECFRLVWEAITWTNGRNGTFMVTQGKTVAARRVIPMTVRVRAILEKRWQESGKPIEGWVWAAPTRSGHMESSSLKRQHKSTFRKLNEEAAKDLDRPPRPFVLYDLRHTFLTRLGESGCDAWTLARIAGHSNVSMSSRYVHPSEDAVLAAMANLGGHKNGHKDNSRQLSGFTPLQLSQQK
jgi:integrase